MPLYEYECTACHKRTEKIQKFSDPEITTCPHCGGHIERVVSAPAISFKGGGWFADGYGNAKPKSSGDSPHQRLRRQASLRQRPLNPRRRSPPHTGTRPSGSILIRQKVAATQPHPQQNSSAQPQSPHAAHPPQREKAKPATSLQIPSSASAHFNPRIYRNSGSSPSIDHRFISSTNRRNRRTSSSRPATQASYSPTNSRGNRFAPPFTPP